MTYVMMTCPRKYVRAGRKWLEYFESQDCHKWIIALEHGKNGLAHWQIRFKVRGCETKAQKQEFIQQWKYKCAEAHIEFSDQWCDYERKEGNFVCSDDNNDVVRIRFGHPRMEQLHILQTVESQGDREIDVWYDPSGNHGKTWLTLYLFERGLALVIPRYCGTPREISNFVCSSYNGQRYIIYDIPRANKITPTLYESLEELKDGLVHDPRYYGKCRNVRGAKIIVFTNQKLDTKKLSKDRWRLHGINPTTHP